MAAEPEPPEPDALGPPRDAPPAAPAAEGRAPGPPPDGAPVAERVGAAPGPLPEEVRAAALCAELEGRDPRPPAGPPVRAFEPLPERPAPDTGGAEADASADLPPPAATEAAAAPEPPTARLPSVAARPGAVPRAGDGEMGLEAPAVRTAGEEDADDAAVALAVEAPEVEAPAPPTDGEPKPPLPEPPGGALDSLLPELPDPLGPLLATPAAAPVGGVAEVGVGVGVGARGGRSGGGGEVGRPARGGRAAGEGETTAGVAAAAAAEAGVAREDAAEAASEEAAGEAPTALLKSSRLPPVEGLRSL